MSEETITTGWVKVSIPTDECDEERIKYEAIIQDYRQQLYKEIKESLEEQEKHLKDVIVQELFMTTCPDRFSRAYGKDRSTGHIAERIIKKADLSSSIDRIFKKEME